MLDIKDLYQQRVSNCADRFVKIILNPLELQWILNTATNIVEAKKNETTYKKDGASLLRRYVNGLKGEAAVAKHLGIPIINPDVGVSIDFDTPDIPGYNIGIKSVEYGHFPVIPKFNTYPQIICICHPTEDRIVYVCGLADTDTLNKFQYDDLILDPNLKEKGTKTGFWGFTNLLEVSKDTIEPYKLPDSIKIGEVEATFEPIEIDITKFETTE